MAKDKVFIAKQTFHAEVGGVVVTVHRNERVREGHPLLKGREMLFEAHDENVKYEVEEATAEPGRKRGA